MKFRLFFMTLLASNIVTAAVPMDGWYSRIFGGYSYLPNNLNTNFANFYLNNAAYQSGYNVGGSFGYKSNPLRYEGEYTWINADLSKFSINNIQQNHARGSQNVSAFIANIYYDFPEVVRCIEPYLGVGIGYTWINTKFNSDPVFDLPTFNKSAANFTYQGTAGISFNPIEYFSLDIAYRYLATNQVSYLGKSFQTDMFMAGATYRFDGNRYQ